MATPIRNRRSTPCTELLGVALTNKKLPGYIESERTILLLFVCVMPSILSKFSVGMGAMSAPGNN